jgi:hypothetical protein
VIATVGAPRHSIHLEGRQAVAAIFVGVLVVALLIWLFFKLNIGRSDD